MRVIESVNGSLPSGASWDAFVARDPHGHLLQTWAWGDLKASFGWRPVRLVVERDGQEVAGAQVLYRPFGPFTLGYVPKGPVLASDDPQDLDPLWAAIHRRSRRMRAVALKVEPEWRDEDAQAHARLQAAGFHPNSQTIQPRRTIIVDLSADEEEILTRMKSKWRYNVGLSIRKGVEVHTADLAEIERFFAIMQITGERDAFAIHSLDYYRQAWELFAPSDRVRLLIATHEGQPLAGLMVYAFNGAAWYMYGASSRAHRNVMPNHQLQWRAMQWAKSVGCSQYDLWGITDTDPDGPSAELSGVERFKAGFGGDVLRYVGAYDYVYIRPLYRLMNALWTRRRRGA
ncbi:MAG: peptidoglycan bridge formation glycyltransferase FemA/FemB family protein [Anaerolineae bacterium]|nr:peptidoglycan bridge formation glycyltransferase FemA/FemB family protein [Anaerolineae bacterium]